MKSCHYCGKKKELIEDISGTLRCVECRDLCRLIVTTLSGGNENEKDT